MKKLLLALVGATVFVATTASADEWHREWRHEMGNRPVRDWPDLARAHEHVEQAIREMERARAANHYDMQGHGVRAEEALRSAEHEIHEAIEAAHRG